MYIQYINYNVSIKAIACRLSKIVEVKDSVK